jgi:hypothetical protein
MWLELELARTDSPQLSGAIGPVGGSRQPFTGVMELVAIIERLLDEHPDHLGDDPRGGA